MLSLTEHELQSDCFHGNKQFTFTHTLMQTAVVLWNKYSDIRQQPSAGGEWSAGTSEQREGQANNYDI